MNFTKITGLGNDFILFDNRHAVLSGEGRAFFREICQRRVSVGADGVILLEASQRADFKYRHFNSDGSDAEMCGNGARSICYYAFVNKIVSAHHSFEVNEAIYEAWVKGNQVKLKMPPPEQIIPELGIVTEAELEEGGFVQVGVPHLVIFSSDVTQIDLMQIGRHYRFHPQFTRGANVNFVQVLDAKTIQIRTYERGVEAQTLACGTGSTAAAIIAALKKGLNPPIQVNNPGGSLQLDWGDNFNPIYLEGAVKIIYEGRLWNSRDARPCVSTDYKAIQTGS